MTYALTFVADLGAANTGLTIRAQLYDSDGTPNGAELAASMIEVDAVNAPGVYAYRHLTVPDDHDGIFAIYNNADKTQRVAFAINPVEVEISALADAVWDELATDHTSVGKAGEQLWTDVDAILADTNELQVDDVPGLIAALNDITAAAVWASASRTLTQGAASVTAAVSGDTITVYRGTTWSIALTGLGDISAYDTVYFSVKHKVDDSDDNAWLRVKDAASGLLRFMKAAPAAATNGTITIDDAVAGDITITINEAETAGVTVRDDLYYDIKGVDNDGQVDLLSFGDKAFNISGDITRAIT